MRIAYIITHLGQSGVNNVVLGLINVMQGHGHGCHVFYLSERDEPITFPCQTQKLKSLWSSYDFSNYDVVHSHGLKPDLYVMLHKPAHSRTLFVSTLHCYVFQDFKDLFGTYKGLALSSLYILSKARHDKIVALSKDAMAYYLKWYGKKRLTYAYNTRILDKSKTLTGAERNEMEHFKGDSILVGMNCVLLVRKGIDVMIKAMRILPDNYKLFIVGSGKEELTFKAMVDKSLKNRVYFAGRKINAYRYLPYYDIYALPSRSEGFPLSLLEAAVYGRKVVSSMIPTVEECFTDTEVVKFNMPSERELADAILTAMGDDALGGNLEKRFNEAFSPAVFYDRYIDIYHNK